jgi:two-component system, chemotaxis family, chemotaxis protein CheY
MALKTSLHVAVVDDMTVSRMLICNGLEEMGIVNVAPYSSSVQALKALTARPAHLVVSGLNMPDLDGLELLHALREHGSTQKIGFILVTGRADASTVERARQYRLNNFLAKPFTTAGLRACVEAVVGRLD